LFGAQYARENSVRSELGGQTSILALTFTQNDQVASAVATQARSPADNLSSTDPDATPIPGTASSKSVYGRGYRIAFRKPEFTTFASYPENALASVTEMSLLSASDNSGNGTWTCPTGMQFRVVRAEDVAKPEANCQRTPDPAVLSPELALVRNSLRVEDWYIDMTRKCIIPKKSGGACYGSFQTVVYNAGSACNPAADSVCMAVASICYRTN
jgi:hypothetical protein